MLNKQLAIVHDALINTGGAERTVAFMSEAFPEAPIFTSVYLPERTYPIFKAKKIYTLPGSRFVHTEQRAKQCFALWYLGFRQLDLSAFDLILSSTTFAAKHVRPLKASPHVCYCYAPFRFVWNPHSYGPDGFSLDSAVGGLAVAMRPLLRHLDYQAMQRVTSVITSCENMRNQIETCYQRQAAIIHPPIRVSDYPLSMDVDDYYLCVSRLESYKRIDLAVKACTQLDRRLIVVGIGRELARLQMSAGPLIEFKGRVTELELRQLYARCRAVIFPGEEDYGLVPLEAQASGRPVIAYGAGGSLETIVENETGVFFREQSVDAVKEAILTFEGMTFNPLAIQCAVKNFDVQHFIAELRKTLQAALESFSLPSMLPRQTTGHISPYS